MCVLDILKTIFFSSPPYYALYPSCIQYFTIFTDCCTYFVCFRLAMFSSRLSLTLWLCLSLSLSSLSSRSVHRRVSPRPAPPPPRFRLVINSLEEIKFYTFLHCFVFTIFTPFDLKHAEVEVNIAVELVSLLF